MDTRQGQTADDYTKRDVAAQERMAEGTEELVRLTDRQNVITAVEAGLLLITIVFTAWAAIAASRAAGAADKAVEVTSNTARRQLRAYIAAKECVINWENERTIRAVVTLINTGQTPAYQVKAWLGIGDDPEGRPPQSVPHTSKNDVGSGLTSHIIGRNGPMSEDLWGRIRSRKTLFYFWGEMTYRDVFDDEHITSFRFMLNPDPKETGIVTCGEGNYSD
jgi:hypothetical protein